MNAQGNDDEERCNLDAWGTDLLYGFGIAACVLAVVSVAWWVVEWWQPFG